MSERLSPEALKLIAQAYQNIDGTTLSDFHTHIVGLGKGGTGVFVHPGFLSWSSPRRRIQFKTYLTASGIEDEAYADLEYLVRLRKLIENKGGPSGKHYILAFDQHYRKDGTVDLDATEFYIPNKYVFDIAQGNPDYFVPVMSVHPYRKDAIEELTHWAGQGVKFMKWLPNAMGMDPGDPDLEPFYLKMKELGVTLITHAGHEAAVEADEHQRLGNPLLLRKPLDLGVRVIVAHCASWKTNEDLDDPNRPQISNFLLFSRLMDNPKYRGLIFGEISTLTQFNRMDEALNGLLEKPEWHDRLVNGSDYPLPAINFLIHLKKLVKGGYITDEEADLLREIYGYNPLTFDFVLKRTIRHPKTGAKFADSVFGSLR